MTKEEINQLSFEIFELFKSNKLFNLLAMDDEQEAEISSDIRRIIRSAVTGRDYPADFESRVEMIKQSSFGPDAPILQESDEFIYMFSKLVFDSRFRDKTGQELESMARDMIDSGNFP